jgi:hypothetical protein
VNVTGTLAYRVNGGGPISINAGDTGSDRGSITANGLILFRNPLPAAALGDVPVLSAGSVTTAVNLPGAARA